METETQSMRCVRWRIRRIREEEERPKKKRPEEKRFGEVRSRRISLGLVILSLGHRKDS